ncbi:M67 family metallopeptidase [Roseospira visakhapatnamensis]|uniref:Proteasome lid subunit RPN8/RPN11 n=1 Tax=Roseospira visakhapatnamensis TaxID=390880 RepID=A0A7W6RE66_9PROT|nr:M67 family metallopeptidase [Roseospira visakhapatnamensis]MBB4266278.1 proteasome lid subunit RPN8/RPN11 [Roseospira visakhapatnamensis]
MSPPPAADGPESAERAAGLVLPPAARAGLVDHLRAAWPAEGCALLSGRTGAGGWWIVEAVHPAANVAASDRRHDRFEVDPAARLALTRALRGGPLRLIGHAHSHPGRPPVPSQTDHRAAAEPDLVWVIVGLASADDPAPGLTAWAVTDWTPDHGAGGFRPLPVRDA